jgi:hypothetical protein
MALTDRDRAILDFERTWWTEPGPKDTAIRERFELSGTRYYQLLTDPLDDPEALAYDPLLARPSTPSARRGSSDEPARRPLGHRRASPWHDGVPRNRPPTPHGVRSSSSWRW